MPYLHVDLCCGLGGWQAPFEDADNWRTIGVDIRSDLAADIVGDVRQLPLTACEPNLLTMSPPCSEFTKWKLPWYDTDPSMSLIEACIQAADYLQPQFWILENSVGLSQFWRESRENIGPFHFWGDYPPWDPEWVWKHHNKLPLESRSEQAAKIPFHYADSLRQAVEVWS